MKKLDIIVPVYNEPLESIKKTLNDIKAAFQSRDCKVSIIVVNDGSEPRFKAGELRAERGILYVEHSENRGYGAALKTGILSGDAEWIAITDSDGTYPVEQLPVLLDDMPGNDMVIGIRTGQICEIPLLRRFPKKVLNMLASYMAGARIRDLNSGLRIFSRDLSYYLWDFFPKGFSFTSTITMGAIMGGFRIKEISINYFKRSGSSSINPIRDTVRFFRLVCRLGLIFYPTKIFTPVALALFSAGFLKGLGDYFGQGNIGNLSAIILLAAVQIFMLGLLGKLIVHSRFLRSPRSAQPALSSVSSETSVNHLQNGEENLKKLESRHKLLVE
jgi:glycosyltransferase involved in cell wall biosynthesis